MTAVTLPTLLRRFKSLAAVVDTATQIPKPPTGAAAPAGAQQFLRLPVDSARKLRYYDRPELNDLVTEHAKDMAALQAANAALRKVRQKAGAVVRPILFLRRAINHVRRVSTLWRGLTACWWVHSTDWCCHTT